MGVRSWPGRSPNAFLGFADPPESLNRQLTRRVGAETIRGSFAGVAELADAMDSKSIFRKEVGVRVPPPAHFLLEACNLTFVLGSVRA